MPCFALPSLPIRLLCLCPVCLLLSINQSSWYAFDPGSWSFFLQGTGTVPTLPFSTMPTLETELTLSALLNTLYGFCAPFLRYVVLTWVSITRAGCDKLQLSSRISFCVFLCLFAPNPRVLGSPTLWLKFAFAEDRRPNFSRPPPLTPFLCVAGLSYGCLCPLRPSPK